ncbi:MAG: FtsX-like permease family protein [Desulfurococcaceae archaeon]|nr:FtsX-like permease family protein [Desulfurococcaceae archaeon]
MTIDVVGRAREIGIMKVVDAKNSSVIKLLLLESVIMDGIGGCTGIVIGIALSYVVISLILRFSTSTRFLGFPRRSFVIPITNLTPVITLFHVKLALVLGIAVSVIAGVYPAYRAYRLRPVEVYLEISWLVLVYKYGRHYVQALRSIDLDINRGDVICIVGPSGSCKTTLLNIIEG